MYFGLEKCDREPTVLSQWVFWSIVNFFCMDLLHVFFGCSSWNGFGYGRSFQRWGWQRLRMQDGSAMIMSHVINMYIGSSPVVARIGSLHSQGEPSCAEPSPPRRAGSSCQGVCGTTQNQQTAGRFDDDLMALILMQSLSCPQFGWRHRLFSYSQVIHRLMQAGHMCFGCGGVTPRSLWRQSQLTSFWPLSTTMQSRGCLAWCEYRTTSKGKETRSVLYPPCHHVALAHSFSGRSWSSFVLQCGTEEAKRLRTVMVSYVLLKDFIWLHVETESLSQLQLCDFAPTVSNCKLSMKVQGINDSLQHAQELSKLLSGRPVIAGIPRVDVRNSNPRFRDSRSASIFRCHRHALSCTVIQNLMVADEHMKVCIVTAIRTRKMETIHIMINNTDIHDDTRIMMMTMM